MLRAVVCTLVFWYSASSKTCVLNEIGSCDYDAAAVPHSLLQRSRGLANTMGPHDDSKVTDETNLDQPDSGKVGKTTTILDATPYIPGKRGASWTHAEVLAVKAKLWRIFAVDEAGYIYDKLKPDNNFVAWRDYLRPAPKLLRLGFHDCFRYADGSGGCDGCLMWEGMGERYSASAKTWSITANDTLSHNNGLMPVVQILEAIYTDPKFPDKTPALQTSLRDSGKSRADLWALAAIIAVEYGIEINNRVCMDPEYEQKHHRKYALDFNAVPHCHHLRGKPECKVTFERPIAFVTGRKDCVTDMSEGYMTSQVEVHPDAQANGKGTAEFFHKEFGFTGRETVAIMGAHTMGRVHHKNSLFRYVWVKNGGMMFNNQYYRNLVGTQDFRFVGNSCNRAGDAEGNAPMARWVAHVRMDMATGGPAQFIQEKWICPEICATAAAHKNPCCTGDSKCKPSCQDWRFASGHDETALPAEMGLYLDFNVSETKLPTGCLGLKHFTADQFRNGYSHTWSGKNIGKKGETECPKQSFALPLKSTSLSEIVEEYAMNQAAWVRDFVPALEKMLANGYASNDLDPAPDQWTDVVCPEQDSRGALNRFWSCYTKQSLSKPFMLKSLLDGRVVQEKGDASGNLHMGQSNADQPASLFQVWQTTSFGDHFVNAASGQILVVKGQGSFMWSTVNEKALVSPSGEGLDRGWIEEDGAELTIWEVHGSVNQQWEMVGVKDSVAKMQ